MQKCHQNQNYAIPRKQWQQRQIPTGLSCSLLSKISGQGTDRTPTMPRSPNLLTPTWIQALSKTQLTQQLLYVILCTLSSLHHTTHIKIQSHIDLLVSKYLSCFKMSTKSQKISIFQKQKVVNCSGLAQKLLVVLARSWLLRPQPQTW